MKAQKYTNTTLPAMNLQLSKLTTSKAQVLLNHAIDMNILQR